MIEFAGLGSMSRAARMISGVATVGRPPTRPRARAASRPSRVPETISSRMNSARAAKTWKTSRPPGVVVQLPHVHPAEPTAQHLHASGRGVHQGAEQPQQGGLPCPVGPQQRPVLSLTDCPVDPVEDQLVRRVAAYAHVLEEEGLRVSVRSVQRRRRSWQEGGRRTLHSKGSAARPKLNEALGGRG